MGPEKYFLLFISFAAIINKTKGCQIEGVNSWLLTVEHQIYDFYTGTFWSRSVTNIEDITSFTSGGSVDSSRYVTAELSGGNVTLSTSAQYPQYEENETSESMSFTLTFRCTDGSTNLLTFEIGIIDTNNNAPIFLPTDSYEFTITPPVPPGFSITGCDQEIIVRDIDLTTTSIEFTLEENPYVEIVYLERSPADYKQFLAGLRTKDLIRSLPGDVDLVITATDVDRTGDPPRTTRGIITLKADDEFQFPEEPIFTQPFYLANYSENRLILQQPISLLQGYDDQVVFSLDQDQFANPELSRYFDLVVNDNEISIEVSTLPPEMLPTGTLILVVRADRQYTSGATATVIVEFPEVLAPVFEQAHYSAVIVDNILQPLQLTLSQGFENEYTVSIVADYASHFSATHEGSTITLSTTSLDTSIIDSNNFLTLQVVAQNLYGSSTAVVTLEIIKDDSITPVFEKAVYLGEYMQDTGLALDQIILAQGFDESVSFSLEGDHSEYFAINNTGATVMVTSSYIPSNIWPEQQVLLTLRAVKPRSVTAATVVAITLPSARELAFESLVYSGTLQDDVVYLPTISLENGYSTDVSFIIEGVYASYFSVSNVQNQVSITRSSMAIPEEVILQNNFLSVILRATGTHAISAKTTITLEVIKQDLVTPVFSEHVYKGYYNDGLDIGNMSLAQGYDDSVSFRIDGEHSQYFSLNSNGNSVNLILVSTIPADIIFEEKVLIFTIIAEKPYAVDASATISIVFPTELTEPTVMQFSQKTYLGITDNNNLDLENIILQTGFDSTTVFSLSGEHSSLFSFSNTDNIVTISLVSSLTEDIIANNNFLTIELEASGERAVAATTTVIIDILRDEILHHVFSNAYYKSVYANGVLQELTISLEQGYDDAVVFELEGDNSIWFTLTQSVNEVRLNLNATSPIPEEVLENNNYFLFSIAAEKIGAFTARAAIFIDLPKEAREPDIIRFSQNSYIGRIENDELFAPMITLLGERDPIQLSITGTYAEYFEVTQTTSTNVQIQLVNNNLPEDIEDHAFIVLDLEAQYPEAISGHTTIIFEILKQEIVIPVFEQAYYIGEFTEQVLQFEESMRLIQGFDETVVFTLSGDDARWFELVQNESNNLTLAASVELQNITDRSHLTFSIIADKPNSISGTATIVISLLDFSKNQSIGFQEDLYTGRIESGNLYIDSIILEEGYSTDVQIEFSGDYVAYFQLSHENGTFTLQQSLELTEEILAANNVLVFTIAVQNEGYRTHTTVILEIIKSDDGSLFAFEEPYYVGSYSIMGGFTFDPQITLLEGYDATVSFSLEGDESQWFGLVQDQYPILLTQNNPIPNEVVSNAQQLIFVIVAQTPGNITARSTIIVTLVDDTVVLQFERNIYIGTVDNNTADIDMIILSSGYSNEVTFSLLGDLATYFTINQNTSSVYLSLQTIIPENEIPSNGIVALELQASAPQAISAYATLILGLLRYESESLQFSEVYYTGSYSITDGLLFLQNVSLAQGFEENVQFVLEGDDSQYFATITSGNSVSLRMVNPVPAEVMLTNSQLIFTIRADKPGSTSTRATIVISLIHDVETEISILQFEQVFYEGTIQNNVADIDQIVLIEGFNENISFFLLGDLSSYFSYTNVEETLTIVLQEPIPEELIPQNGIIVLELRASASEAISARAVIVLSVVREERVVEYPVFSEFYYEGQYSEQDGFVFSSTLSLQEGYDETVLFALEGNNSQYFNLVAVAENSLLLQLSSVSIPIELLMNNQHLIFTIKAEKQGAATARATIVISLQSGGEELTLLEFEKRSYVGTIENRILDLELINLLQGYNPDVSFTLLGELNNYFTVTDQEGVVTITLETDISNELIPENGIVILELRASAPQSISASTAIILNVLQDHVVTDPLLFAEPYYVGNYDEISGLVFEDTVSLTNGFDENVQFILEGDSSQYFSPVIVDNSLTLSLATPIPSAIISNNQHLIFTIRAERPNAVTARTTIVISLQDAISENSSILGFDRLTYLGFVEEATLNLELLVLSEGYSEDVTFEIFGDLANYFNLTTEGPVVSINIQNAIPEEVIPQNGIIVLELKASAPQFISAHAAIVLTILTEDAAVPSPLIFSNAYYTGSYTEMEGLVFDGIVSLSAGYDTSVMFYLEGDHSQYFEVIGSENNVTLRIRTTIPVAVVTNNHYLIFTIRAQSSEAATGSATIVISLIDDITEETTTLEFSRSSYIGSIENDVANIENIVLSEGYSYEVSFTLRGDLADYFILRAESTSVSLFLLYSIPDALIPANRIIILEIEASMPDVRSAYAAIIFEVITGVDLQEIAFSEPYYTGQYSVHDGLELSDTITISQENVVDVQFSLEGENSQWFTIQNDGISINLILNNSIPEDIVQNNRKLIFLIIAQNDVTSARSVIIISVIQDEIPTDNSSFDKVLYLGRIENGVVYHETISVTEFDESTVEIIGDYGEFFSSSVTAGVVTVQGPVSLTLPADVSFIALELWASSASSALVLDVIHADVPATPSVSFGSPSYILRVGASQTGLVGRVEATADNGEALQYSLDVTDDHLLQRISISTAGELHLSAPANNGVYSFQAIATTVFTQIAAYAQIHLTVEAISECGAGDYVLPPLQILDRDEETPHTLIPFNSSEYPDCRYTLASRWPADQSWLYVDETGLHTSSIDREHESIAFMALSQVQVVLTLECDSDSDTSRTKRSADTRIDQLEHLGPYDYGSSKWILTDSILYNPRQTVVNLIVNDINDNYPIFVGVEDQPIAVGWPVADLEERILPRYLAEIKATDADVGENAAIVYWSDETGLAVSPSTGLVHVADSTRLQDNSTLTVYATDRNGQGLTSSLNLMVKFIDTSHIVVVTVKHAFLDDEEKIIGDLSNAIGYEVKALRTTVVTDIESAEVDSRNKREAVVSEGASMQLYVYGIIQREPVGVERLTEDIIATADNIETVIIASTVSLEDHLESLVICPLSGRDTALLVSTIVLAVLLFILIVAVAVWYFLKWWKKKNYEQFSDANSLASRDDSLNPIPKPENISKPRMDIEELKRSERRLQEMLEAPVTKITVEPTPSKIPDMVPEAKVTISEPPMIIQSIDKLKSVDESSDDDDEFGERKKARRKSVVTFNENVEKIIHVEDRPDVDEDSFEIYRL